MKRKASGSPEVVKRNRPSRLIDPKRFKELLALHASWPISSEMSSEIATKLFKNAPEGLLFPFPFQTTMCTVLEKELKKNEALFVYDSVYRLIHEMTMGTVLPKREVTCFDEDGEPIPRKSLKCPTGYFH